jgi:hypothetical protein
MPSVDVVWNGNCRDPEVRYRLLSHLQLLATLSDSYLSQGGSSPVLKLAGGEQISPRANIESIDQDVSGRITISSGISAHPQTLITRAREAGLSVIEPEDEGAHLIVLDKARLRGIDFKLCDPEGDHPGASRMSFVFVECSEYHFLDGRLVEIADGGSDDVLRSGHITLHRPSIHLCSHLEDWTDCLFSWIRFFLIGDFWWQRREELKGYVDYRDVFGELQTERGSAAAEEATFGAVLETFSQHAEHRASEVEGQALAEKASQV